MLLPEEFPFSQSALEDFQTCAWRFYLRHVLHQPWPALVSEPATEHERHQRLGERFHRLVQQHLAGVPAERLSASVDDPDLAAWWTRYLEALPADLPGTAFPEHTLVTGLDGFRLLARYDALLATEDGQLVIFDWKTTLRRPPRARYARSWQTRLYRYVAVRAGGHLLAAPLRPEQVRMVYWFPAFPDAPYHFPYDAAQFQADQADLHALLTDIARRDSPDHFPRTADDRACHFCPYRSLCERGVQAGPLDALFEDTAEAPTDDLDFSLDQIAEIEF